MDLVGLVSGGKDSIYNLLEAVRLGHRVVCLANLHPAPPPPPAAPAAAAASEEAPQELDSWMYQTVGWNVVPALCQALGLPLHRQATRGQAVHTGLAYPAAAAAAGAAGGDEVEDLHALLAGVLAAHPTVRGVAVGAILSTYQRVRVESVCARLGLVPVALLWQRQQRGLLQDMAACGLRALLVKVASHGLTPERHLGREAGALLPALLRLHAQLGLHVCGEGGEYETLALDSPLHARGVVEVGQSRVVAAPGAGSGATAHLHITEAAVRERTAGEAGTVAPHWREWDWRQRAAAAAAAETGGALPPQLGGASSRRRRLPQHAPQPPFVFCAPPLQHEAAAAAAEEEALPPAPSPFGRPPGAALQGDTLLLALESAQPAGAGAAAAGARALLQQLRATLAAAGGVLGDVVNVHLSLSDMAHFQEVNAVFQAAFAGGALAANPPSRSCLQFSASAGASGSVRVELEALCVLGSARSAALGHGSHRRTLLVASLSRWAPMCIGPYAQCVTLDEALVYPAGQIGLLPETMALVGGGLLAQLQQAMLNLARVGSCAGTGVPCAVSMAVFVARAEFDEVAARAAEACVREWDAGRRAAAGLAGEGGEEGEEGEEEEDGGAEEYEFSLGPYAGAPPAYHHCSPPPAAAPGAPPPTGTLHPCAVIPVAALPRGAAAEVEAVCLTGEAIALCGGLQLCAEEDSSAGGGGGSLLHYCTRARALQGCAGCAWVGATGQWGQGQWQALAEGVAARALRALRAGGGGGGGGGSLAGAAASWAVRAFYEAASGAEAEGEVQAERRGLGAALRAALGGCAAQVAVALVPLCSSSAEWRAGAAGAAPQPPLLLLPVPAARGAAAAPGQRTLLLQVTAYNAGAMRGQLWLRRAYKSAGVTE